MTNEGNRIREAERQVVGGFLLAGQADRDNLLADAIPRLPDFQDERASLVVDAIRRRWKTGETVDGELIAEDLEDRGELADAGGVSYIAEAVNSCPTVEHLPEYVKRVLELHREQEREEIRARLSDGDMDPAEAARRLEELEADDNGRFVAASEIEPEAVTWLWPRRLAQGKVHLLDGDPGLGKSTLLLDLAARLSNGSPWPDAEHGRELQTSLVLSAEDGAADTVVPRLKAAGADLERVK